MIVLVVSFVLDGRIDGRVLVMSFPYSEYGYTQPNGITHEGEIGRRGRR